MTIQIFQINDCDWCAGDCTPEEILAFYMKYTGCTRDEAIGDDDELPTPVPDGALDYLKMAVMSDEGHQAGTATFREHLADLVAKGTEFPMYFGSTEY